MFLSSARTGRDCEVSVNRRPSALDTITAEPRGPIKVTVPTVFGRLHVAPHIPQFVDKHPQMQVRLHLTDMLVDLIQERIDLAIRVAELYIELHATRREAMNSDWRLKCDRRFRQQFSLLASDSRRRMRPTLPASLAPA
jgi:DNA-binding transcriptional LysR family regulator